MFTRVEAKGYRCLRYVSQDLDPFQVLVGPNASGKSTFLDVIAFLGDLVEDGPETAIGNRGASVLDLLWSREPGAFELAIEAALSDEMRSRLYDSRYDTVRYEVAIRFDSVANTTVIENETVLLLVAEPPGPQRPMVYFPDSIVPPDTILMGSRDRHTLTLVNKTAEGNDSYYSEAIRDPGKRRIPNLRLGPSRSALGNLPADEQRFPVSTWLRELLARRVALLQLDAGLLRGAARPGKGLGFQPDGSNLPWVIHRLEREAPERLTEWLAHVRTALPDLCGVRTVEREEDRHRYLLLTYSSGLEVPSWTASDGTLRLIALTLLAYLDDLQGTYLIEEPENGIHPLAMETVCQALAMASGAQILLATHSPVVLGIVEPAVVRCFARSASGATAIVKGLEHPNLAAWQGQVDFATLFAAGVLG